MVINRQAKIRKLQRARRKALGVEGGSQSKEYQKINSLLAYYQNPKARKKYLASLDPVDEEFKRRVRYLENREKMLAANAAWRAANPEKARASVRAYRAKNPRAKISMLLSNYVRVYGLKRGVPGRGGRKPTGKFEALVGCTRTEFQAHLESKFTPEMNWENRGKAWELDHIAPLVDFDLTDPSTHPVAYHFTNYRPLTRAENLAKGYRKIS